ncbi:rhomboid family intramembrane serine protease [Corynebacterium sp. p3-SID1145]|uniref:rhomboid family intramembrane serine protease n=1 Tax=unclassified Corynebacterium TaxID=2624378 RepID=UPI0021AA32F6|nr:MULTISPECIES: rhomboid family intramembrane serine protease [unclassified Corynebacterium]MCT1451749.1 rhomboid family intramembrane serine protease [Corynebacterium sp. p3-SID1145]MCT1460846.1 rhomboid family intramembrane serine protease [Corynebacterium sp. p3-SID1140]
MNRVLYGAPATATIASLCVGAFLVAALDAHSLIDVIWSSRLGTFTVLWGPFVESERFGLLRAVTSGFMHLDITHLTVNVLMLVVVGAAVERAVGTGPFVLAYLAGILGGSAAVLWFGFDQPTAGASGALYALMALIVAIAARSHADLRAPLVLVGGNVVFTLLSPTVSLWGHLGGLLAGALMAAPLTSEDMRVRWGGAVSAAGVAAAAIAVPLWA